MKNSALNYALWLLGRRDRSIGEIKEKLLSKEHSEEETNQAAVFLIEKKFLDDERFSKNYIRNQINLKPLGKYQLRIKLQKKLVPKEIIEQALEESDIDETELARGAAEKWHKSKYQALNNRYQGDKNKIRNSLTRYLISRGFNYENIKEIVNFTLAELS